METVLNEVQLEALQYPAKKSYSERLQPVEPIEGEEWKVIPNTNDLYFVSNKGRIKKELILKNGKFISGIVKPYVMPNGRLFIGLTIKPKHTVKTYVSRLVLETFGSSQESHGLVVKHTDGNLGNCDIENLSWSTRYSASQAMQDAGTRTRKLKQKEYLNKLGKRVFKPVQFSPKDYEEIRTLHESGISQVRIAERFKCTQSLVSQIVRGKLN